VFSYNDIPAAVLEVGNWDLVMTENGTPIWLPIGGRTVLKTLHTCTHEYTPPHQYSHSPSELATFSLGTVLTVEL